MKILKKSFVSRARLFKGALFAYLLAGIVVQSEATIYTVTSTVNSTAYSASYDTSVNGFTSWTSGGVNQLALQSLYYSENSGAISLLTSPSVSTSGFGNSKNLIVTYSISGSGTVVDTMNVNGSSLGESIVFNNTSGTGLNMKIFQYSDFVLGGAGAAGSQTLGITPSPVNGGYAVAAQSGGGQTFTWKGDASGYTTLVQADSSGSPFGAFIGPATDLDNATLTASGNAVFGYEFYGSVGTGNNLSISETSAFPVPEPSFVAMISAGMLALALLHRRRVRRVLMP